MFCATFKLLRSHNFEMYNRNIFKIKRDLTLQIMTFCNQEKIIPPKAADSILTVLHKSLLSFTSSPWH